MYICKILYTAIGIYVLYSYFFCVLQRYASLNKIWELTENGGVNQTLESSFPLFIKIPVEASKREANSELPKQMELSTFLFVMSRIEATLAANLSYKYCLRKDFCQQSYGPTPILSSISFNNRYETGFLLLFLPFCLDCPGHLVAPYRSQRFKNQSSSLHSKATLLSIPVFYTRSLTLYLCTADLFGFCPWIWTLASSLNSVFQILLFSHL